jgi:preprotein translocase subunit YajC
MSFFISSAFADAAASNPQAPAAAPLFLEPFLLGGFAIIFYLMIWRPQSKRAKEQRELLAGLSKGDEVATTGGLLGKITRVTDDFVVIEVADGTETKFQKAAIASVLPKGTLKNI